MSTEQLKKLPIKAQISYILDAFEVNRLERQYSNEMHLARTRDEIDETDTYHDSQFINPFMREVSLA